MPWYPKRTQQNDSFFCFSDTTECYADQDDDIIFEDFARLRLKGETDAWYTGTSLLRSLPHNNKTLLHHHRHYSYNQGHNESVSLPCHNCKSQSSFFHRILYNYDVTSFNKVNNFENDWNLFLKDVPYTAAVFLPTLRSYLYILAGERRITVYLLFFYFAQQGLSIGCNLKWLQ